MKAARQQGFSLIELVLVIVILGTAGGAVLGQFANIGPGLLDSEAIQTAAQLAQERAEGILAERRGNGYTAVATGTFTDTLTGNYSSYGRTVTVATYTGSACPVANCKQITVSVTRGGSTLAEAGFMLADY